MADKEKKESSGDAEGITNGGYRKGAEPPRGTVRGASHSGDAEGSPHGGTVGGASPPKLNEKMKKMLLLRNLMNHRRPVFLRQEWHRYKRLQRVKWRVPRGMHSKMRRHYGYRPNVVSIGYRGPKLVRGLHPSGFKEVLVHNLEELKKIDPNKEACRIARTVGQKKREVLLKEAEKLGIRVLNPNPKVRE